MSVTFTAIKLGFLALVADGSTRTFVVPAFVEGMIVAAVILAAFYAVEANSKKARILIFVLLGLAATLVVVDRIRSY